MEFRLKYLNGYVDKSIYTFSGKKKDDFYFKNNKDVFEPYRKKVLFFTIHNLPTKIDALYIRQNNILHENTDSWVNEVYQRDYIQNILDTYTRPFIIFVCDVDEIPKTELYMNIKNDYNILHNGAHIQMLFSHYGFKWKKNNCIWKHPYVITDKGCSNFSFNDVRLTRTEKTYNNSGWHVSYCFKINDIIRKLESFAHTEYNIDKHKNKDYLLNCIQDRKNILNEDEQFVQTENNELPEEYKTFQDKINNFYL
jgi:beta-1,4-mannosyl-glycoprotein beta-1,4-N-acetylglucosaminyltransferase